MTVQEIENIFTYHAPNSEQVGRYAKLRDTAKAFALLINALCPESREKSLAFTHLQFTVMCANAAIAIHEDANG